MSLQESFSLGNLESTSFLFFRNFNEFKVILISKTSAANYGLKKDFSSKHFVSYFSKGALGHTKLSWVTLPQPPLKVHQYRVEKY